MKKVFFFKIFLFIFLFQISSAYTSEKEFKEKHFNEIKKIEMNTEFGSDIMMALFKTESSFNNNTSSYAQGKYHLGYGQLSEAAVNHVNHYYSFKKIPYKDITSNPKLNIYYSTLYLNILYSDLYKKYPYLSKEKILILSLISYNWGIGNLIRYLNKNNYLLDSKSSLKEFYIHIRSDKKIPLESREYVRKIIKYYLEYIEN